MFLDLNGIKIRSQESAIFKIDFLAGAKEKSVKTEKLFADITYYKLRAGKHFGYYIIGLRDKGYGVSCTEEILNQTFIILRVRRGWETMGKESKIVARMDLRRSQRHGGTMANAMQSDLLDMVRDVVQANHWDDTSGIDESRRVLRSQSEALQLGRQI